MLLPLLHALLLASTTLAQPSPPPCPPDSTLGTVFQNLTISTAPEDLYPHLGDFYSPSWQYLLSDHTLTFSPPQRTFTIASQSITETLLRNYTTASAFHVHYNLTSSPFTPSPSVLILTYDVSLTALLRICVAGAWSQVIWKTTMCVAGADASAGIAWFETRNGDIVKRVFASVAEGWVVEGSDSGVKEEARCSGANYTSVEEKEEKEEEQKEVVVEGKAVSMLDGENAVGRVQARGIVVGGVVAAVGCLVFWGGVE